MKNHFKMKYEIKFRVYNSIENKWKSRIYKTLNEWSILFNQYHCNDQIINTFCYCCVCSLFSFDLMTHTYAHSHIYKIIGHDLISTSAHTVSVNIYQHSLKANRKNIEKWNKIITRSFICANTHSFCADSSRK